MFLQIHTLTSYPAALLNRDDAGLAKRVPFGDATRLRVSSQCLKRHWRDHLQSSLPDVPDGLRTRHLFPRVILPRLIEKGIAEEKAKALCAVLIRALIDGGTDELAMSQPVLFGAREADYFVQLAFNAHEAEPESGAAADVLKKWLAERDMRKNLAAMSKSASGLTAALFGRFVTSDILSRVDAPVHVAHAFTVHAAQTEMDYFTVVDDLNRVDEQGAAHASDAELGAGIYYGYVVVDVPLLVANLSGVAAKDWRTADSAAASRVLSELIIAVLQQSPGAKLGSTAPYSRAEWVLLEVGKSQPRSLANAYLRALAPRGDLMQAAVDAAGRYVGELDGMYGPTSEVRAVSSIKGVQSFAPLVGQPVPMSVSTALKAVFTS